MPLIQTSGDPVSDERLKAAPALLRVTELAVGFRLPQGVVRAVDRVSFDLKPGEIMGIVGESGSGKSQVLLAIMGLMARNAEVTGRIDFAGQDLLSLSRAGLDRLRGADVAMIFQDPMTSLNPYHRIGRQLAEVLIKHKGMSKDNAHRAALAMLDRVRIPDAKRRMRLYPHELSGGMRQRVMIAMALLCEPRLLLADEPTTALDVTVQAQILHLMQELVRESGTSVVIVTHDLGVVAETCDRVLVLYGGRVMERAGVDRLFEAPAHPYTHGLLAAMPRLSATRLQSLMVIPGAPRAAGLKLIPGCPFAPRCERRIERCVEAMPAIEALAADQQVACYRPYAAQSNQPKVRTI
ncbi:MAG TPA: ABC transporter ATP-binding protein [Terriglobia bacterium]|nr:ABC transporter ATP-binding protein [Terriglobia bacterium]